MADFTSLGKWDANYACFFLQKLTDSNWLLQDDTALGSIDHLKNLSKHFAEQAINPNEKYQLNPMDEQLLEQQWLKILTYEKKNLLPPSVLAVSKNITELKVCLVNIGIYIMFKNSRRRSDLEFAVDILSLALSTVRACIRDGLIEESERLLELAFCSIRARMDDETVYDFDETPSEQLHLKFKCCCSSLFVYRVLSHYRQEQYNEILAMLGSTKQEPIEFDVNQSDSLSRICFNIALGMFNRREFESAIIWLKFAHSFGKQVMESGLVENCSEDPLTLLAACYMHIDINEKWSQIIEILDYGDQTAVNLELRLQAMLVGENDAHSIEPSISRYLALKYQQEFDHNSVKKAANELFSLIEEKKERSFLINLLGVIPWEGNQTTIELKSKGETYTYVEHIRWICAKYAARCFVAENQTDKFFQLLCEVPNWPEESVDDASVYEVMSLAETVALRLVNEEGNLDACLRWYDIIIQFANRHGIDCSVIWNAMACLLQLSDRNNGFQRALKLAAMIPEYDLWADLDPLCIRLQMALRSEDYEKSLQITMDLENVSRENDWDKIQKAISHSASIVNNNDLACPMLNYLETAAQKCKTTFMKAILLRFILRFQMDILRNELNEKKELLLTNMLNTITTAYSATCEAQKKDHLLIEIRTWFARTAWNLGRFAIKQSAYFRHHLFKLSSQFFALETGWMKETEIAMVKAMEAAFDFGLSGKRIAYVHILRSALQVANGFYQYSKGTERIHLIRLMEFHALCELKNWQKVESLVRNYVNGAGKDVNAKHDAGFYLSLASIIISTKDAKNREVVTTDCGNDIFQKDRVSVQQQTCLTSLAVTCLKMAIDLSTPPNSPQIILCCRWIVDVLFNPHTIWEAITLKENLGLLDELMPRLRSSDFPFPEVRINNSLDFQENLELHATVSRSYIQAADCEVIARWFQAIAPLPEVDENI